MSDLVVKSREARWGSRDALGQRASWRDRGSETARRVARLRRLAWTIDALGRIPGTRFRFGLNSVIGLAPGFGDATLVLISLYIVNEARRIGLPRRSLQKMLWNVAVEAGLGAMPVLGDLLDVGWKANLRNLAIIEKHVAPGRR